MTTPVSAQGFLQSLFGGGQQARPRMMPPRRSHGSGRFSRQNQSVPWWQHGQTRPRQRAGRYTAMCVRMCDGYYWPMSNRAKRGKFYDLSRRCEDSCNGDAKLFYMPSHSSDVKRMTDLSGRAYEYINTAFLYRKKLVKSCTCKPMPWSNSARAQHMQYAAREAEKRLRLQQQEQRRLAMLQKQQANSSNTGVAWSSSNTSGRTIVESLDGAATLETPDQNNAFYDNDNQQAAVSEHVPEYEKSQSTVRRVKRRRKRVRIRKRRPRTYRPVRRLRRTPKVSYNSGNGAARSRKVWRGNRPRRR